MKIDQVKQALTGATSSDKPARSVKNNDDSSAPQSSGTVQISSLSTQLQAFQSDAAGEAVDTARVQEIKQAISEGRFKVNADVVADKLLQTVKDLLQNRTLQ